MRAARRVVGVAIAAWWGGVAVAVGQVPDFPCTLPVVTEAETGTVLSASPWDRTAPGEDPSRWIDVEGIPVPAGVFWDRWDELQDRPWLGIAGPLGDDRAFRYSAGVSYRRLSFDENEGEELGSHDADIWAAEFAWQHEGLRRRNLFAVTVPHVSIDIDAAGGRIAESGLGDVGVFAQLELDGHWGEDPAASGKAPPVLEPSLSGSLPGGALDRRGTLLLSAWLPTGDEERLLGTGEPTLEVGYAVQVELSRHGRAERLPANARRAAAEAAALHCRERVSCTGGGSVPPGLDACCRSGLPPPGPGQWPPRQAFLRTEFSTRLSYTHVFADDDLSRLTAAAGVLLDGRRVDWEVGLEVSTETGSGTAERGGVTQVDAVTGLRFMLAGSTRRAWFLTLGGRFGLGDEGLRDRFTPTVAVARAWNPGP